jgi:serine/threonine-protein kinase
MGQIGKYETIGKMGSGAMGTVYRARDKDLGRDVALKTIRTGTDIDPQIRERFYREARACARLQHPNIITVYELGEAGGVAYIAMELLEGEDFKRIIADKKALSLQSKLKAMAQVCDAVGHAHRHGVIHRDIKPSNLLLTDDGLTKVLDFGIARLPSSKLTVAGQILGTPNYMAPEQILGSPCDGRADLFSVAVVLFELLTYHHPFQSDFIPTRIAKSDPDSLFQYDSSLPVTLEKVVNKGLSKNPERRYQSALEFAEDLRAISDGLKQLPSEQAKPAPAVEIPAPTAIVPTPVATRSVPAGQDPDEWRLSEALRLFPEFEAALNREDRSRARDILAEMEASLAGDIRFAEALRTNRKWLEEAGKEPLPGDQTIGVSSKPQVVPASELDPVPGGKTVVYRPTPLLTPEDELSPQLEPEPARPKRRWMLAVIAAIVALLLIIAGAVFAFWPVPKEPAQATAAVQPLPAPIYAGPNTGEKLIVEAAPGTELNILAIPVSREQAWTRVQQVQPKVYQPGYVRTGALRDWHGLDSASALALGRMLGPGDSGTDDEIESQVHQLSDVVSRFGSEPAAGEARRDIVHLNLTLAKRLKSAGRPSVEWQPPLQVAEQMLAALRGDPRFAGNVKDFEQQINELNGSKNEAKIDAKVEEVKAKPAAGAVHPPPPPPSRTEDPQIASMLTQAETFYNSGDYASAEHAVDTIFLMDPNNARARAMQAKIKRAHGSR